jgi:glycosidase
MKKFILFSLLITTIFAGCKSNQTEIKEDMTEAGFKHPEWTKTANIYEVNIRQYTKEGTFAAFIPHMERLQKMGVDVLWFMPINPIGEKNRKGTMGSYYAVKDYTAVNPEFGTLEEFKALVAKAHELGMHVIIDWVANHTSWDNVWTTQHPDWFDIDSTGNFVSPYDWTDVISLNYNNKELWKGMADAMKYWVVEADIDGFRCDVAGMVETPFWDSVRLVLDSVKPVFMLAEAEQPDLHEIAFDANYSWELFHVTKAVAKGEKNVNDLWDRLHKDDSIFKPSTYRMRFTSNHDENSWNGTDLESFGDAHQSFSVLSWVMSGIPLIYSGQEAGLNKRLSFFEKDTINWSNLISVNFYKQLSDIKKQNKALWNGQFGGSMVKIENNASDKIFSFSRTKDDNTVIVIVNLSNENMEIDIFTSIIKGNYKNAFTGKTTEVGEKLNLKMEPWQYIILTK